MARVGAACGSPAYEGITQEKKKILIWQCLGCSDAQRAPLQTHGITLIALIITIILLLILAGVAIHFTLGENGILKNAEIAGNKYKQEQEKEKNALDEMYSSILVAEGSKVTLTMEQLDEYIKLKEKEINAAKCSITVTSSKTYTPKVAKENIDVVLDNIQGDVQNKFILENGKIKIGKDVQRIFVSVYAYGKASVVDTGLEAWAMKNGVIISSNFCRANDVFRTYPILTYPTIINVEEGDYISVGGTAWAERWRIIQFYVNDI